MSLADDVVQVDASGGERTITLPLAADVDIKFHGFTVRKTDEKRNAVVVRVDAADEATGRLIDGRPYVVLTGQSDAVTVQSDGTKWLVRSVKSTRIALDIRDIGCREWTSTNNFDCSEILNAFLAQTAK